MRWDLALLALRLRLATPTPTALPGNRGAGGRPHLTDPRLPLPRPRGPRPAPSAIAPRGVWAPQVSPGPGWGT